MTTAETDLQLSDGRTLHVYDTPPDGADLRLAVFWHHGTPNTGAPPAPLFPAAARRGIRWVSYDRPGYGGSTPHPGRDVASAAADVASVADALGIGQFAVMGHSGGGSHALACGALLPQRVVGVVCVAGNGPVGRRGAGLVRGHGGLRRGDAARRRGRARGDAGPPGVRRVGPGGVHPGRPRRRRGRLVLAGDGGREGPGGRLGRAWWTTSWPTSPPGGSTPARSARQRCSCTAARTGSCPFRTAGGWQGAPPRQSCGCARTTGTSRSSNSAAAALDWLREHT